MSKRAAPVVQSTLTSYLDIEEGQLQGTDSALERIENDVKRILIKLDQMGIQENSGQTGQLGPRQVDCSATDAANLKVANNLLELANCEHMRVEILEDGCRVTCISCHEYIKANPHMKM